MPFTLKKMDKERIDNEKNKGQSHKELPGKHIFMLGAIKSPKSKKDYVFESRIFAGGADAMPAALDLRGELPPIRDQGVQGSCVAQSAACVKEYHEHIDVNKLNEHMSPQFIYNHRSNFPKDGMFGRDVMDILLKYGCPLEKTFTYGGLNANKSANEIPASVKEEAQNFIIKAYARVGFNNGDNDGNIYNLKKSIKDNGPCVALFPVYSYSSEFWNKVGNQEILGGHAVAIIGWNESGFIIRNSWGVFWGQNGYSIYKFGDFISPKHWEIWTAVDAQSKVIVKPIPTPGCKCSIL